MMGTRKLSEIRRKLRDILAQLPGDHPADWLRGEIKRARSDKHRDPETLEMLLRSLRRASKKSGGRSAITTKKKIVRKA